jgi:Na+/melibiose symporter-like transporter
MLVGQAQVKASRKQENFGAMIKAAVLGVSVLVRCAFQLKETSQEYRERKERSNESKCQVE